MQSDVLTLIVARPGRMRDGLQALLAAMPQVERINLADDSTAALEMISGQQPTLVLLDSNPLNDGQVWTALEQIKALHPQTRCLVLVDNGRQEQRAQATGADGVLVKGFSTAELFAAIEKLLSHPREPLLVADKQPRQEPKKRKTKDLSDTP